MLTVNNIEAAYLGVISVLHGISLEVGDGKIVALIGANGGGKTTTLKAISGLLRTEEGQITSGDITFDGKRIDRYGPEHIARMGDQPGDGGAADARAPHGGREPHGRCLPAAGTGPGSSGTWRWSTTTSPRIREYRKRTSGYLSGGEQQMMVIGRALMADPRLMLLDEPSLGLAPLAVQAIYEIIRKINKDRGLSMLIVEQNVKAALGIADYGYVMENGRIVLNGPADKLMANEDVKEFYMGISSSGSRKNYREIKHYRRRKRWMS